jgi:hypothetical protein
MKTFLTRSAFSSSLCCLVNSNRFLGPFLLIPSTPGVRFSLLSWDIFQTAILLASSQLINFLWNSLVLGVTLSPFFCTCVKNFALQIVHYKAGIFPIEIFPILYHYNTINNILTINSVDVLNTQLGVARQRIFNITLNHLLLATSLLIQTYSQTPPILLESV